MSDVNPELEKFVTLWENKVRVWAMHMDAFPTVDEVFFAIKDSAEKSDEELVDFVTRWKNNVATWDMNEYARYTTDRFLEFMEEDALKMSSKDGSV